MDGRGRQFVGGVKQIDGLNDYVRLVDFFATWSILGPMNEFKNVLVLPLGDQRGYGGTSSDASLAGTTLPRFIEAVHINFADFWRRLGPLS